MKLHQTQTLGMTCFDFTADAPVFWTHSLASR
jgi:hypothetical protein